MYLRHSVRRKNGKKHIYWRLVRSVRRDGKVVQETVAQLGELDAEGRAKAKALARQITVRGDQRELFEEPVTGEATAKVRLDRIRLERGRSFGDVWLGWRLWQALRLEALCEELLPRGREQVPWSVMAAVLVIARLCEPSSELHIAQDWYRHTALEDLLGLPSDRINDDRLYRALDRLVPHKRAIEQHLVKRLGELFDLSYDLLLYDVTSTYFEGLAKRNPLAQRGHSRDHRPDCKQVCIALVVTREGMPLGYEVFAGNRVDVTTVEEIVETMEARYGIADRVWVMDRGMSSAENVAWLQESGRRYLIGAPKSELKKWSREIAEARDWRSVRDGVEAKLCAGPDGSETFLLCRSADRREKERAMHERFAKRIEARLESLGRRLERSRKRLDREAIGRQIGRILGQNSRAAGRYRIQVVNDPTRASGLRLAWSAQPEWDSLGPAQRGHLHPAHQRPRLELRGVVAHLHPAHRGGGGLPDPQERPLDPARLAPETGAGRSAHPGLLPGLCAVEDARAVATTSRARQQPPDDPEGDRSHPEHRRGASRGRAAGSRAPNPLRGPPRQGPGGAARSAGAPVPRAAAHPPAPARNVVPTRDRKCPEILKTSP